MTPVQTLYRWFNDNPEATYKEALEAYEHCLELEKKEQEKLVDDALTNYVIRWKPFSLYEHKETITSSDTPVFKTFLESIPKQEPLYTEEQVREAIWQTLAIQSRGFDISAEEIIKSLKQHKKH